VLEKLWVLQNVRSSLAPPCTVVLYGFGEHPFRRWGAGQSSVFQHLLGGGFTPELAAALHEGPLQAESHEQLLVRSGWERFGSGISRDVYRVVIAQRSGSPFGQLTARELGVAELAARGWKSHRIGIELSIAPPTVRGAIDRCVSKLGLASSVQLPLLWSTLASAGRCFLAAGGSRYLVYETPLSRLLEPLTNAERGLVERLLHGDTQRAMAGHRGVSARTVANQMSRLFEKLGVSSRSELVVRLLELGARR
jgi:DNA-binding NarL/FixJ family response regulator